MIENFNISFDAIAMFFCLFGIISLLVTRKIDKKSSIYFIVMFSVNFVDALFNMLGIIFKGNMSNFGRYIIPVSNFAEFLLTTILGCIIVLYFFSKIEKHSARVKFRHIVYVVVIVSFVMLVVNIPTHFIYYIDSSNVYHRGDLYYLIHVAPIGLIIYTLIEYIRNFKKISKQEKIAFASYILIILTAIFAQMFYYGIFVLLISISLSLVVMFWLSIYDTINNYYLQQMELKDIQTKIIMSQIQPHFLYNSLTAIMAICDDSQKTRNAIADFSKYLRGNLDSLNYNEPISFEQELKHVETYVRLEQLRFEDNLKVEYDIKEKDFVLPSLAIQVLVENAIKHGITKTKGSGTIKIASRELVECFEVTVEDDGQGFDVEATINDGKTHIGLKNISNRLHAMCGGTININSEIGKGTIVTVIIPKKEGENDESTGD